MAFGKKISNYLKFQSSEIAKVNAKIDCLANWLLEYTKKDKSLLELISSFPKCIVIPPPEEGDNVDEVNGEGGSNNIVPCGENGLGVFDKARVEVVDLEEDDSGSSYYEDEEPRDYPDVGDDKASYSVSESKLAGSEDSDVEKDMKIEPLDLDLNEVKAEMLENIDGIPSLVEFDVKPFEVKKEEAGESMGENNNSEREGAEIKQANAGLLDIVKPCSVMLIKLPKLYDHCPDTSAVNSKQRKQKKKMTGTKIAKKKPECITCNKRFSCPSALIIHNRANTGVKPFRCSICGKRFNQKGSRNKHVFIHTPRARPRQPKIKKSWQCEFCTKSFHAKSLLLRHILVHTGERPFQCKVCQHRFSEKGNLNKHFLIHTGEKPFVCDDCGKRFRQKNHLAHHRKQSCK